MAYVDGVTPVVTRTVLYETDELLMGAMPRARSPLVQQFTNDLHNPEVGAFAVATYVIGVPQPALLQHLLDGAAVIRHEQPVAHVLAVAVHRYGPAREGVQNDHRDELLRELVGAVVIGAIRKGYRQAVGAVVGPHQVVRSRLAGGIRGARIVRRVLVERGILRAQGTVYLVGGHMMEAEGPRLAGPGGFGGLEQRVGADDVGVYEGIRTIDGAVHVGLGGEMHHRVDGAFAHQLVHQRLIADVAVHEAETLAPFQPCQVEAAAGIGERIQHRDPVGRVSRRPVVHEVGAYEAGAAGDKQLTHPSVPPASSSG